MTKKMKAGIIGFGRIGTELYDRLIERGWRVPVIVRSSGVYAPRGDEIRQIDKLSSWLRHIREVDIVGLCIPTLDDGKIAYEYIKPLVKNGIPVVTSEKGALGNYFLKLKVWLDKIGYSATVGGGGRLLDWLIRRLSPWTREVHLIINGTLNFIWDGLDRGRAFDEMVGEAKKLGYAEPGTERALDVINMEACKDLPMKTSVVFNICGFGEIRAKDIKVKEITKDELKKLVRESASRRYIVSIVKEKEDNEDVVGGFKCERNGWYVSAGFKNRYYNPLFRQLVPPGVNNAVLIHGLEGTYATTGPGAGPTPTVMGSMIKDIENISRNEELLRLAENVVTSVRKAL